MSRTMMIMVSDNHEVIEQARNYWANQNVTLQVYSAAQWREGLDSVFFRQQLVQGTPSLSGGQGASSTPSYTGTNVVPFPTPTFGGEPKVQKMEELEAKAIEEAIGQYKGNLTEAAKALGIGRATLYRKVKQYQIDPSAARKRKQAA